jgi:hypothetical protein
VLPPRTGAADLPHSRRDPDCWYDADGDRRKTTMPSKPRKPKPFKAAAAVKAAAREKIGTPPPTRAEPASKKRKTKSAKHKPTLGKLLEEEN